MSIVAKALDTLTGRKVNATALDLDDAVAKARVKVDAKVIKEEAEARKVAAGKE